LGKSSRRCRAQPAAEQKKEWFFHDVVGLIDLL
jgi:hypothetical protein